MLEEGIIRPCKSSQRAQVLVTSSDHHKKRMVIDYLLNINKYTQLDTYSFPRINDMVNKIAKYKIFGPFQHLSLVIIKELYIAFKAGGNLYDFNRIPIGLLTG